jgi:hypothetical protein
VSVVLCVFCVAAGPAAAGGPQSFFSFGPA